MVERGVEADRELVELEVDAELEQERVGAELPGDSLEGVGSVGDAAQGMREAVVRLGCAIDETTGRGRRLPWIKLRVLGRVGIVFHGAAPVASFGV